MEKQYFLTVQASYYKRRSIKNIHKIINSMINKQKYVSTL